MILHLIRHPKPVVEPNICYGRLDLEAENAASVAELLLADLPPDLPVWSSPLRRCRILAECLHPAPLIDERLVEMDFGRWEGLRWDAVPRAELDSWAADVAGYAPPAGESPLMLQHRALDFVAGLAVPEAVVVTHAGVIRTLLAHWQDLPPAEWTQLVFEYGSRTSVELRR